MLTSPLALTRQTLKRGHAMGERTPGLETNTDARPNHATPRAAIEELGSDVAGSARSWTPCCASGTVACTRPWTSDFSCAGTPSEPD
jgi:hypothetical protein